MKELTKVMRYQQPDLPPIPPSIRVFSNESTLLMRWPQYWSFSFTHTQRPRARTPFFDRPRTTESAGIRRRQHKTPNQMRRGFGARSLWWEKSLQGTKKPAAEKKPAGKKATPEGKKAAALQGRTGDFP